jgi:hypothetical protein
LSVINKQKYLLCCCVQNDLICIVVLKELKALATKSIKNWQTWANVLDLKALKINLIKYLHIYKSFASWLRPKLIYKIDPRSPWRPATSPSARPSCPSAACSAPATARSRPPAAPAARSASPASTFCRDQFYKTPFRPKIFRTNFHRQISAKLPISKNSRCKFTWVLWTMIWTMRYFKAIKVTITNL